MVFAGKLALKKILLVAGICFGAISRGLSAQPDLEGGIANTGARFFLETRFSQFFFTNSGGNANFILTNGDPVVDTTASIYGPLPGPFAGKAINCRACHLVEEHAGIGNRTYADFARRSPIPDRGDGRTQTPRNSLDLVNALLPHATTLPLFLHNDGEFVSGLDLIKTTLTGRNFGWKPTEYATAVAHIARVVREDDASGSLAQDYGGWTYAEVLEGGPNIPEAYRISPAFAIYNVGITNPADPNYVSDERILDGIANLIHAYLETLIFSQDLPPGSGVFNGSPYDVFLIKNGLPRRPLPGETPIAYSRRLLHQIDNLSNPQFVTDPADGHLVTHVQRFQFGAQELAGLKIFFAEPDTSGLPGKTGNCIACHSPPEFTDFIFHNTGAAQEEYDSIHGAGAFMAVPVPSLSVRQANHDAYLPATPIHPNALGTFITPPTAANPGRVDLGLWNVFANPDFPKPQPALQYILPLIVPTPAPRITLASKVNGEFVFSGSNGVPGGTFYVLASTNVEPLASWNTISTNTFDAAGGFSVTNSVVAGGRQFFRVASGGATAEYALPRTIALFKTPDVRDLSSSEPYLHTGRMDTLQDMIGFYRNFSALARAGAVRNPDPQLSRIFLDSSSVVPLVAFLRSLNEDYQDIPCPCD